MEERTPSAGWTPGRTAVRLALLAVAYYGLARLGLLFALPDGLASPVWPPAGLAMAAVALWGFRALPGIFVGALAVEAQFTGSLGLGLLVAVGATGSAALGGWLVARAGGPAAFDSLQGVGRFAIAVGVSPLPASTIGSLGLLAIGDIGPSAFAQVWWTWYLGDAAGALVLAPALLRLRLLRWSMLARERSLESAAVLLFLVVSSAMIFGVVPGVPAGHPALVVLVMPPLVWAAFRLGPGPAALALLALDTVAVAVRRTGRGPFAATDNADAYLVLQAFVFAVGLMALGLAALASERRRAALELERRVAERTARLQELNGLLSREVEERRLAQSQVDQAQHIAQVGTWRWDITKPHAEWSPELYRVYGLDPLLHVPSYDDYLTRVHPDDVERVKAATEAVFRDHKPYSHDERVRRPDGSWRDLHTWAKAELGPDGKLVALVGACQDTTDSRKADAALRESLERFRALADASPIGIVHTRADGVVDYVNGKWRQITGVRDHTDQAAMRRSVHPDDQPVASALWDRCVKEGREFECDLRFVHADGIVRYTRARAVPVRDAAGALTGYVSALADITDQRAADAKDREVRRLREQAEFKTNFLRTAAHELGTPLTPITIQMRILRGLLDSRPARDGIAASDEERKAADILERNIRRLGVLVRDMLESARLQSGRLKLAVRPMDMAQMVHEVVETFQEPAIQTGVALDTQGPAEMPIVGDPDRLSQVLYNLLSNAMKFTPPGGQIHVRLSEAGDSVRVTVQDTGPGFQPEQAAQLFQPFSQLPDAKAKAHGGSGLGLYISRGIVEQHGGRLEGESSGPGQGATFSFVVPRVTLPFAAAVAGSPDLESLRLSPEHESPSHLAGARWKKPR